MTTILHRVVLLRQIIRIFFCIPNTKKTSNNNKTLFRTSEICLKFEIRFFFITYKIMILNSITFFCIVYIHFNGVMTCHCEFSVFQFYCLFFINVIAFICTMFVSFHYRYIDFVDNVQIKQHQSKIHLTMNTLSPSSTSYLFHLNCIQEKFMQKFCCFTWHWLFCYCCCS